jgi:hypothetical protein
VTREFDNILRPHVSVATLGEAVAEVDSTARPSSQRSVGDIRWVCLSDLHLGAENSILSDLPSDSVSVDPMAISAVLEQVVECLRALIATNERVRRPTLILAGDVLELALAEDNTATMVFANLLARLFQPGEELFDDDVYFIPGNHDHHLWESARERQYRTYVNGVASDDPIKPPWHVTRMFEDESLSRTPEADLLDAAVERSGLANVRVKVVYPNLGIAAGDRIAIIHHGHFTESMYRLMSTLKAILFPHQQAGRDIWDWESDNFAWIDFFWSTLGRSGAVGADVGTAYAMLRSRRAVWHLVRNLTTFLVSRVPVWIRWLARVPATFVAYLIVRLARRRERANPIVLSDSLRKGLSEYLSGPVKRQLERECSETPPPDIAFVFGHTHKPFEKLISVDGFADGVRVYNSGGWVVDTAESATQQGGAVIVIDEACNIASLRMYNQTDDPVWGVKFGEALSEGDAALRDRLAQVLDFSQLPWVAFSEGARSAVAQRHHELPKIIERAIGLTKTGPANR